MKVKRRKEARYRQVNITLTDDQLKKVNELRNKRVPKKKIAKEIGVSYPKLKSNIVLLNRMEKEDTETFSWEKHKSDFII